MTIFAKIFATKPKGGDHMSELEKLDAEIAETRAKIDSADEAIEAAESAYEAALDADDEAEALAQLEAKAAAERLQKLHSDRLPMLLKRRPFVVRDAAEPDIRQACAEVQQLCDREAELVEEFHGLTRKLKTLNEQLSAHSMETNAALGQLINRIKAAGHPSHPEVRRVGRFVQDSETLFTIARWYHPWGSGSISAHQATSQRDAARLERERRAAGMDDENDERPLRRGIPNHLPVHFA